MHQCPQFVDSWLVVCENGVVVANKIAECRIAKNVSKAHLARRIGRSRAYVTQVEKGVLRPGGEAMLRIARYFGKPVEEIFQVVEGDGKLSQAARSASGLNACESEAPPKSNFPAVPPSTSGNESNRTEKHKEKVNSL